MSENQDPSLLAAGYALGTLTDEERAMYEAHLASSRAARREARGFSDVVDVLAEADAVAPPPELKARIMAQLATTPQLAVTSQVAVTPQVTVTPQVGVGAAEVRARARWFRRPASILIAAAAAAALFVGGTAVGVAVGNANPNTSQQASALAQITAASDAQRATARMADGGSATVVWSTSLAKSAIVVKGAKPAPAGKTYQLWYIRNGKATSAGLMSERGGTADWQVLAGQMRSGDTVGLTVEPAGGSKQPTTKPVVVVPT